MSQSASWIGFTIPLPGAGLLQDVVDLLETLLVFLEICKAILEAVKIFLVDFGNAVILLLEALIALIQALFKALQQTGLYAYFDIPDPFKDPNFKTLHGGFNAFKTRWKGSLLDLRDANRPQPVAGLLTGGFFLFVVDSDGVEAIIQLIKSLMAFFKNPSQFLPRAYPPPVHVKAVPLSPTGDPILNVANLFASQSTSIAIEWQLPGNTRTPSNQFGGVISQVVQSYRVPNWLIEFFVAGPGSSAVPYGPPNTPIQISPDAGGYFAASAMTAPLTTGRLVQVTQTGFTDPRNLGNTFSGLAPVVDDNGDPVLKASYYAVVSGFAAFLEAELGTVRFVFNGVQLDTDFYVRVRGYFGTLSMTPYTVSGSSNKFVLLNWQGPLKPDPHGSPTRFLPWPSATSTQMSMGKPSKMIHAKLSSIPDFDILGDIKALYLAAFSLNFHVSLPAGIPEVNAQGIPLLDARGNPVYYPQFDSAGNPLPANPQTNPVPAVIGQGSASSNAGPVAGLRFPVTGSPLVTSYADWVSNPDTGKLPQQPWQNPQVIYQATKLSIKIGAMFMEQGGPLIQSFKTIMRGPMPAGAVSIAWPGGTPTYLEQLVKFMTLTSPLPTTPPPGQNVQVTEALANATEIYNSTVDLGTAMAYAQAFSDSASRRNVLAGINFLNAINRQGIPPNWISVSLLDLIPWAGQLLYDLIAKIQALVDAFKGVIQEIVNFINMLERKINTLEQFIEYLISILNTLLTLEVGFYVLPVPSISGDVTSWMSTIDQAGGDVPQSGPTGYTAGICLAYLGPDVEGIAAAFALLF
jgi:hypothetical protein